MRTIAGFVASWLVRADSMVVSSGAWLNKSGHGATPAGEATTVRGHVEAAAVAKADHAVDLDALALGVEKQAVVSYVGVGRADERDALGLQPLTSRRAGRGSEARERLGLGRDEPVADVSDPDLPAAAGGRDRKVVE